MVMPITTSAWTMLQRNLMYTAITRAKKVVVLVGSERALAQAVRTPGRRPPPHRPHPPPQRPPRLTSTHPLGLAATLIDALPGLTANRHPMQAVGTRSGSDQGSVPGQSAPGNQSEVPPGSTRVTGQITT